MALSHVLLTSLLEKPSTGSELARRFDRSMGFFWNATHQQIYRELASMLKQGWISTVTQGAITSRKKTYQVEALGRAALQQWLTEHSQPAQLREDLMVRLRAQALFAAPLVMPELKKHLALHQAQLAQYHSILEKDFQSQTNLSQQGKIQQSILELGIAQEQLWVQWLEQLSTQLQTGFDET